jgi:outer membrane biosynthesis protein TonB
MAFLDTKHKRKSAVLTSVIGVVIILLLFLFGLTYFDPPKEYGIAVNFGTSDFGSGNQQPTEALKPAAQSEPDVETPDSPMEEVEETVQEEVEEVTEPNSAVEEASEEVITQVNEEAIAIKKREEAKRKMEAEAKAEAERIAEAKKKAEAERKAEIERQRIAEQKRIEKERSEKEAKRKNLDALMGGFSNDNGKADGGEGNDNQAGDKGKVTGDPNASGYYGIGGDGSGGNYRLGNRTALNKPKPEYDCNEEGRVVVSISVDRNGNVISAEPGIKGTTNSATCLLDRAREAALKTKFNADSKAPQKQIGAIIYNFSLSE